LIKTLLIYIGFLTSSLLLSVMYIIGVAVYCKLFIVVLLHCISIFSGTGIIFGYLT
jgi:hypothetical protein